MSGFHRENLPEVDGDCLPVVPRTANLGTEVFAKRVEGIVAPRDNILALKRAVFDAEDSELVPEFIAALDGALQFEPELVRSIYGELHRKDLVIQHLALCFLKASEASRGFVKRSLISRDRGIRLAAQRRYEEFPPEDDSEGEAK